MNLFKITGELAINGVQDAENSLKNVTVQGEKTTGTFEKVKNASKTLAKWVTGIGTAGVAAFSALSLKGGWDRAMAIETSEAKLKGLGFTIEDIKKISENAMASVKGTAYSYGDAMTVAGTMVASGIKPGKELEGVLSTISSTAAVSGREFNDMGLIFSQVAAKGKLQGDEMMQLMSSGIPVLQLLQKNTNLATMATKLYGNDSTEAIQKLVSEGKVSFSDFANSMSTSMGSAAQVMGTTTDATIKNTMSAMSRFGAAIVTPIMEYVKAILNKAIPAIDKLTNKAKPAMDKIIDGLRKVKPAMDTVISISGKMGSFVIKNIKGITTALGIFIATWAAFKVGTALNTMITNIKNANAAINLFTIGIGKAEIAQRVANGVFSTGEIIVGLLTGKITLAQIATGLWTKAVGFLTAAWNANPVGLITTAVVALTAVITAVVVATKKHTEETDKNAVATDKLVEKQNKLNKTLEENKKVRNDSIKSAKEESATTDVIFGKLEELSKVENKTNAQKETMNKLVSELNNLLPDLNLQYDKEKDALNMSTDAIRSNIKAQKELVLAKASQKNLMKIAEDIAKQEIESAEITKQHTKNEKEYQKAKEATQKKLEEYNAVGRKRGSEEERAYWSALKLEKEKKESYDKTKGSIEENEKQLKKLNDEYGNTEKYAEKMLDKSDITTALGKLTENAKTAGVEIPKAISEGMEAGRYAVPEKVEDISKLISFDEALNRAGLAGKEIPRAISQNLIDGKISVETAIGQVKEVIDLKDKIEKLSKDGQSIPKTLSDNLIKGTVSVQDANNQLNNVLNFDKSLSEAKDKGYAIPKDMSKNIKNGKLAVEDANNELNNVISFNESLIKAQNDSVLIPKKLTENLTNGKISVQEATSQLNAAIDFQGLVTKADEVGILIPEKLTEGITNGKILPQQAVENINQLITYQGMIDKAGLDGVKIPTALSNGIVSGKISVDNANNAMNTWINFNQALVDSGQAGIEIPSNISKGIANGKLDIESANTQMNRWIKFQIALEASDQAGKDIPKKVQEGILNGKMKPADAIKNLNKYAKEEADKAQADMKTSGTKSGNALLDGYSAGTNDARRKRSIYNSINDLGSTSISTLNSSMRVNSPSKETEATGGYFLDGLYNGVANKNKRSNIFNAISSFGTGLINKLKSSLKEHSPSKATEESGVNFLLGFGNGLKRKKDTILKTVGDFGKEALNSLNDKMGSSSILDIDINRNIKDLNSMDLNNYANELLNTYSIKLSDADNNAKVLKLLEEYLPLISKLKIYLDSGELVGSLTPEIDKKLGEINEMRARGRA